MHGFLEFIKRQIREGRYRLSSHAEAERQNDGIEIHELKNVLLESELLEDYPDDRRGHSCLLLGFDSIQMPIHVVCGIDKNENVVVITVYIPSMPKWKNPRERNMYE